MVFLARDGHLAFTGSPTEARRYFGVEDLAEVYDRLAGEHTPQIWAERFAESRGKSEARPGLAPTAAPATRSDVKRTGMVRQWWLLTRRNVDVLLRNRLTLAVLLGSPVLVTAMMATLFKRGAFDPGGAADVGPAQIVFWIAFDGFFFGLTYGLLQIVGEMAVFRRERLAGLSVGAYVASKVTALLPVLAASERGAPRCAAGARSAPRRRMGRVRLAVRDDCDRGDLGAGPRPARLGRGLQRRAGRPRPADAVLPSGSVRWRHRPRRPDGHSRDA